MKLHRFIGEFNLKQQRILITDREMIRQLKNVLRFTPGDSLMLCDGRNQEVLARVVDVKDHRIEVDVIERMASVNTERRAVSLYCALLKRENFEWVAQKATEVGVQEIIPLVTARTVKFAFKRTRVEQIVREAAEQSGRGTVPLLHDPMKLETAFEHARASEAMYFFDTQKEGVKTISFLETSLKQKSSVALFIGPEGGWDVDEARMAHMKGAMTTGLSDLTFRGETAALVASYLAVSL